MISVARDCWTLAKASQLAGLSRRTFVKVAEAHGVKPVGIPGMSRILYRKADVDRLMSQFGTSETTAEKPAAC